MVRIATTLRSDHHIRCGPSDSILYHSTSRQQQTDDPLLESPVLISTRTESRCYAKIRRKGRSAEEAWSNHGDNLNGKQATATGQAGTGQFSGNHLSRRSASRVNVAGTSPATRTSSNTRNTVSPYRIYMSVNEVRKRHFASIGA